MTLGRTTSGSIKIKTDGGTTRAVECACCDACSSLPVNLVLNGSYYPVKYNFQTQSYDPPQWEPVTTYYGEQCCHLFLAKSTNPPFWDGYADIYYFPNGQKYPVFNMDGGCFPCSTGFFKEATTEPTFIAAGFDFFNFIKVGSSSPDGIYTPYLLTNTCNGVTYNCDDCNPNAPYQAGFCTFEVALTPP